MIGLDETNLLASNNSVFLISDFCHGILFLANNFDASIPMLFHCISYIWNTLNEMIFMWVT